MKFHIGNHLVELYSIAFIPALIAIAIIVTSIIAVIRIVQRAGYSGWWVLLLLMPGMNVLALWYFGFGPWPAIDSKVGKS